MAALSDQPLVHLADTSDYKEAVLADIYEAYRPHVYSAALRIVKDEDAAEDITQDTFMRFYWKVHLYNRDYPVLPYMLRIARNLALNWVRRVQRRRVSLEALEHTLHVRDIYFDRFIEVQERRWDLERALKTLEEPHAIILRLYFFEGLTFEKIAKRLGYSRTYIRGYFASGLRRIRHPRTAKVLRDYLDL